MYQQRIKKLFETAKISANSILLTKQPNILYFTGFTGDDSWAIINPKKTIIITDGRYDIQAHQQCPSANIIVRTGPITDALNRTLKKHKIKSTAIISEEISLALMSKLKKQTENISIKKISQELISTLRECKTKDEIKNIKKAIKIAQISFTQAIREIKIGITEREFAALLEYKMKLNGAEKSAFDIIVAHGKNSAKPHAQASNNKLKPNQPIVIDFGAQYNGYCSDLTRTLWLGKMPEYYRKLYRICYKAQQQAISAIKSGISVSDIDKQAREIIERAGYGKYFTHSTGHGLGLDVHEMPIISQRVKQNLKEGMIITIEPGIYIPGKGGIRIEDDILVASQGCKVLSTLPKEIDDVVCKI